MKYYRYSSFICHTHSEIELIDAMLCLIDVKKERERERVVLVVEEGYGGK